MGETILCGQWESHTKKGEKMSLGKVYVGIAILFVLMVSIVIIGTATMSFEEGRASGYAEAIDDSTYWSPDGKTICVLEDKIESTNLRIKKAMWVAQENKYNLPEHYYVWECRELESPYKDAEVPILIEIEINPEQWIGNEIIQDTELKEKYCTTDVNTNPKDFYWCGTD